MAGNTSATGGFLNPAAAIPDGQTLGDVIQASIVGITAMATDMVRPRWQLIPPNEPDFSVDWCTYGIINRESDSFPVVWHTARQTSVVIKNQTLDLMISFYGPNADENADILRDGLMVAQNREQLKANDLYVYSVGNTLTVPDLILNQWQYRCDLQMSLRRATARSFSVLDIASINGTIETDTSLIDPFSA